jgi:hypothetical protein
MIIKVLGNPLKQGLLAEKGKMLGLIATNSYRKTERLSGF